MTSKIIYHYVYRITNIVEKKHYYGKRSSNVEPIRDLGQKYFSSSTNKHFIRDQKENPNNYYYKVVAIFSTPEDALLREITLHAKFNVGVNPSFYNKARQTSINFDVTGIEKSDTWKQNHSVIMSSKTLSQDHKNKISGALKGKKLSKTRRGVKRKNSHPLSEEHRRKISESLKGRKRPQFTEEHKRKLSESAKLRSIKNQNNKNLS
jgi:hypothetical protein